MKGNTELLDSLLLYSSTILVTTLEEKNQKSQSKMITDTKILYKKKENTEEKVEEYKGT